MTASCLYEGTVRHMRRRPTTHGFRYRVFMLYLDLSELPGALDHRLLWSARRPAPVRFRRSDHPGDPGRPLDEWVRDLVAQRTSVRPAGPVRLLTHLRSAGVWFNPISVYYCYAPGGEVLEWVVLEVTNTPWRDRHHYVLDVRGEADPRPSDDRNEFGRPHPTPRRASRGGVSGEADPRPSDDRNEFGRPHPTPRRASRGGVSGEADPRPSDAAPSDAGSTMRGEMAKAMHVSPFLPMNLRYRWRLNRPGPGLGLTVDVVDDGGVIVATSLALRRRPLDRRTMAAMLLRHPPMSWRVLAGIHWQALLLWLKHVPYHRRRPDPAEERAAA